MHTRTIATPKTLKQLQNAAPRNTKKHHKHTHQHKFTHPHTPTHTHTTRQSSHPIKNRNHMLNFFFKYILTVSSVRNNERPGAGGGRGEERDSL